jgi:hypothetical protein
MNYPEHIYSKYEIMEKDIQNLADLYQAIGEWEDENY